MTTCSRQDSRHCFHLPEIERYQLFFCFFLPSIMLLQNTRNPESDGGNMNVMNITDIKVSSLNCIFLAGYISFLCLAYGAVCENANPVVGIIWIL